jgi:hypothetical protein
VLGLLDGAVGEAEQVAGKVEAGLAVGQIERALPFEGVGFRLI